MLFANEPLNLNQVCHRPVIQNNTRVLPDIVLSQLMATGDLTEYNVVLVRAELRRVSTGSDILERLLQGVSPLRSGFVKTKNAMRIKISESL